MDRSDESLKCISPPFPPFPARSQARAMQLKNNFNHGWTRINTDEETSAGRSGLVFGRSQNVALSGRLQNHVCIRVIRVHLCPSVVDLIHNPDISWGLGNRCENPEAEKRPGHYPLVKCFNDKTGTEKFRKMTDHRRECIYHHALPNPNSEVGTGNSRKVLIGSGSGRRRRGNVAPAGCRRGAHGVTRPTAPGARQVLSISLPTSEFGLDELAAPGSRGGFRRL